MQIIENIMQNALLELNRVMETVLRLFLLGSSNIRMSENR